MGAYSPLPDLTDADVDGVLADVHRPILAELARRGTPFRGFLYAGLILTADGPVLLECNARLGDPETQVMLPRLGGALGPVLLAAARGSLPADMPARLPVLPGAAVGIVLAGEDYPAAPSRGAPITGIEEARRLGALVFHAGTAATADGWTTNGGRILTVVGRGADLPRPRAHWPIAPRTPSRSRVSSAGTTSARAVAAVLAAMIPRYTLPEMGAIWSEAARFEAMLRVELAVARAQTARGQIPPDALVALETRSHVDVDRILEIERTTDHDVIAFVSQVAETVGPEGRYLHLGLTSSDVVDTGLALQLRAAGERLLLDCDRLLAVLIARARAEAATVMMGRTHSVHAEPTTLGLKLAGWAFELERGRVRLATAVDEIGTGKISGPVGTYSHLGARHRGGGARRPSGSTPTRSAPRSSSATAMRRC